LSDSHDEPKTPLARLQELARQLEAAQQSGKKAVEEITKAKRTTKRVKKTIQRIVTKTAARKLARKK
jgi:hypothetical protein